MASPSPHGTPDPREDLDLHSSVRQDSDGTSVQETPDPDEDRYRHSSIGADSDGWESPDSDEEYFDPADFVSEESATWYDGLSPVDEVDEEEIEGAEEYIEGVPVPDDNLLYDGRELTGEFSFGATPVSAEDLMEEIEQGYAEVVEYDEAPPSAHGHVFDDDSSEEHYIMEDNSEIIVDEAPPETYQAYYSQFDDGDDDGTDGNFFTIPESTTLRDTRTLFGKVIALGTFEHAKAVTSKDNKEQAQNALNIAAKITKIPLGPILHRATQTFLVVFFLANISAAVADMIMDTDPLYFKIPALIFSILEQIILFILWIYYKQKRKIEPDFGQKKQQYIENILHEVLLYPIITISAVGFSTERLYQPGNDVFKIFQLCLLAIDFANLLWAQAVRMYMIHKFMRDIEGLLHTKEEGSSSSPGHILKRAYMTTVGNTVIMLYLLMLLGNQEHTDNAGTSGAYYLMGWRAGLLVLALIIFPIYSIFLFLLSNSFWVLTIFMTINLRVSTDEKFQENLQEKYGHTVSDAMNLAVSQSTKTKKRLEGMQKMPLSKKVFFGLTTFWMIPLVLLWQGLAAMPLISLLYPDNTSVDGTSHTASPEYYISTSLIYFVLIIIFNAHLLLLALIMDVLIPVVAVCFIFYPISIPILFKKELVTIVPDDDSDSEGTTTTVLSNSK